MTADTDRRAAFLLLPLVLAIVVAAVLVPWHAVSVCDNRTFLEMTLGVCKHGLPYFQTEDPVVLPEQASRFSVPQGGRLWGKYPPLYAYVAAPACAWDGVRGIIRFNVLTILATVLATYLLTRRLSGSPAWAAAAGYLIVVATPFWVSGLDVSNYNLFVLVEAWAVVCALASTGDAYPRRAAWAAGFLGGLGVTTHPSGAPMLAGAVLALALQKRPRLALCAVAGSLPPIFLCALLNHVRFGSWNPVSYGGYVWPSEPDSAKEGLGPLLHYCWPGLIWYVLVLAAGLAVKRWPRPALALLLALLVVLAVRGIRKPVVRMAATAYCYTVDLSLDLHFEQAPDKLGWFLGPKVIKAPLQSTPLLALALLYPFRFRRWGRLSLLLFLPAAGLLLGNVLRAGLLPASRMGAPYLHLRYMFASFPLLMAMAVAVLSQLQWRRRHAVAVAGIGLGLLVWLGSNPSDHEYPRRLVILRATLLVSALSCLRPRPGLCALSIALSLAITPGVDLTEMMQHRRDDDREVDQILRLTPARCGLLAWNDALDHCLAPLDHRDIEYGDLSESGPGSNERLRTLIDNWTARGRPVFVVLRPGRDWPSPWPDIITDKVGEGDRIIVYQIRKVALQPRGEDPPHAPPG